MPYQNDKSVFKKRLKNAGLTHQEFVNILSSQFGQCAYCGILLNQYDIIIDKSNGYYKCICFECDVMNNINSENVSMFANIVDIIRGIIRS